MNKKTIFDLFNLKGKTIVLTGSAGRLGSRFADVLSSAGANVVLVDIDESYNKKLELELKQKYHTNPLAIKIDISKQSEVIKLKQLTLKKYKKVYNFYFENTKPIKSTFWEYQIK